MGMSLLATVELGSDGAIEFTAIPDTGKHLMLVFYSPPASLAPASFRFNADAGANYTFGYKAVSSTVVNGAAYTSTGYGKLLSWFNSQNISHRTYITNYSEPVPSGLFTQHSTGNVAYSWGGHYNSMTPITSLSLDVMPSGTVCSLYVITND